MKNIFLTIISALFLLLMGCYKDKGNYLYKDISEVTQIGNIDDKYTVLFGSQLKISPVLTLNNDSALNVKDTTRFKYQWISYKVLSNTGDTIKRIVATTPVLDWQVSLAPATYVFFLQITDNTSGASWQQRFSVTVITSISEGYLILNDVNGKARLDLLRYMNNKDTLITDVLGFVNSGMPEVTNPRQLRKFRMSTGDGVYVLGDKAAYKVDYVSLMWKSTYSLPYDFVSAGSIVTADFINGTDGSTNYCVTNGNAYFTFAPRGVPAFALPINRIKGQDKVFRPAPFVANGDGYGTILYDMDGKRFVRHNSSLAENESAEMTEAFTTGLDLIWMGDSRYNFQTYAVAGDRSQGVYKLYRIALSQTYATMEATVDISAFPDISNATYFAVSADYGSLIYAVGSKVYQGDVFTSQVKLMLDLGTEKISCLQVPSFVWNIPATEPYNTYRKSVMVASYDPAKPAGTNGTIRQYQIESRLDPFTLVKTTTGLGKVVEMLYKR